MELKEKLEELVKKISSDKELLSKFQKDPVSTIESIIGVDLPNDQIEKLADGVKTKLAANDIGEALGKLGGLFGKK